MVSTNHNVRWRLIVWCENDIIWQKNLRKGKKVCKSKGVRLKLLCCRNSWQGRNCSHNLYDGLHHGRILTNQNVRWRLIVWYENDIIRQKNLRKEKSQQNQRGTFKVVVLHIFHMIVAFSNVKIHVLSVHVGGVKHGIFFFQPKRSRSPNGSTFLDGNLENVENVFYGFVEIRHNPSGIAMLHRCN